MVNTKIRLIIFFAANDGAVLYSQQKQDQELTVASDHELLIAKFRLKLKKAEKPTGLFMYDLNQIPYNYTVEVTNRFKGFNLIDRVPEELWMEVHNIVQEAMIKTIPKKKKHTKRCPFHHRELECKSRKSRGSWNNRQVWPCCTK